ncbi:hypothetical protein FBQ81_07670 [Chloroflexi bacterium CFX6]|nr:hypothetical protein [Chloroflexi bacterium CFX6]
MTNTVLSAHEARLVRSVEKIVSPLIREGIFDNFERALSALLLDYIDRQIAVYKDRNDKLEARYKQSFDAFSASLKNTAAPEQEDVWMDWEAALIFLRKWQVVRAQVVEHGSA